MSKISCLKVAAALIVAGVGLSALLAKETVKPEAPAKPILLLQEKDYFVHAVPGVPLQSDGWVFPGGLRLLHTLKGTGEMRILATSGTQASRDEMSRALRVHYVETRFLGIASDAERFYVVTWKGNLTSPAKEPVKGGEYRLLVFWLADGSQLADLALTGKGLPEAAPKETTDKGPLTVHAEDVTCCGLSVSIKGKQIANPVPKN
jgi:hypothetical protein